MKCCKICRKKSKVNKSKICANCLDIKYFKCHCCNKEFSYNELITRNLRTGSMYKCVNPRKERISCGTCKKGKLIMNYNQLCLDCIYKENASEKLGITELSLIKEQVKYEEDEKRLELAKKKIRMRFAELRKIEDPIASKNSLHGWGGLLRGIYNLYDDLNREETIIIKQKTTVRRLETKIAELKKEIGKQENAFVCYDAAKTYKSIFLFTYFLF